MKQQLLFGEKNERPFNNRAVVIAKVIFHAFEACGSCLSPTLNLLTIDTEVKSMRVFSNGFCLRKIIYY